MIARRLASAVRGAAQSAASRLPLPASWTHRLIGSIDVRGAVLGTAGAVIEDTDVVDEVPVGLPENISDRDALPTDRGRWRRSFHEVPDRSRPPPAIASIPHCRIVSAVDEWGLEHSAILTSSSRRLSMAGSRWLPGHRTALQAIGEPVAVDHVVWPWESWYQNHFHWLVRHIPKLAMVRARGMQHLLLAPHRPQFTNAQRESAWHLGIDLDELPRMPSMVVCARTLTVVDIPSLHPLLVSTLRQTFAPLMTRPSGRRIYVRRQLQGRRTLVNEPEVSELLEQRGFEPVNLEQLTFAEQVRTCSESEVMLGLHGAGLANVVFMSPGSALVEIADPRPANPEYYELARLTGASYWLLMGTPAGPEATPGYGDVRVSVTQLSQVLDRLDRHPPGAR